MKNDEWVVNKRELRLHPSHVMQIQSRDARDMFDVAVIGGGVVGCAVLRQLALHGLKVALIEKEQEILSGASSGNSGIVTTGFDVPPESLELELIRKSRKLNEEFYRTHVRAVPHRKVGAVMVAWNEAQLSRFSDVIRHAKSTGVDNMVVMKPEELLQIEPNLNPSVLGGILFPDEMVVNPWLLSITCIRESLEYGATVYRKAEVSSAKWNNEKRSWKLHLLNGMEVEAACVVNAAGLYGDRIEDCRFPPSTAPKFHIKPRKGQFVVFERPQSRLLNHIVMPVPTEASRGVLLFSSVYGDIVIGPTAEEQDTRDTPTVDEATLNMLVDQAVLILPCLEEYKMSSSYAGLRPASNHVDYVIDSDKDNPWVTVAGIRSTGVSACLAIAEHVEKLIGEAGLGGHTQHEDHPSDHVLELDHEQAVCMKGELFQVTHHLSKVGMTS